MPATVRTAVLSAAALVLAGTAMIAEAEAQSCYWLDCQPPMNWWNQPGGAIPRGPKSGFADEIKECEKRGAGETTKSAPTPETRQVTEAGWLGAMVDKRVGDTVIVFARNGVDGMCRPMDYQYFVFVGGRFAGTLSPRAMASRTDLSGWLEEKPQVRRFTVEFARYHRDDPLCCPARSTTVTYEIREAPGGPVVRAVASATKANPR
jgi:hypothetical protein